jgi:hypothetical protein
MSKLFIVLVIIGILLTLYKKSYLGTIDALVGENNSTSPKVISIESSKFSIPFKPSASNITVLPPNSGINKNDLFVGSFLGYEKQPSSIIYKFLVTKVKATTDPYSPAQKWEGNPIIKFDIYTSIL